MQTKPIPGHPRPRLAWIVTSSRHQDKINKDLVQSLVLGVLHGEAQVPMAYEGALRLNRPSVLIGEAHLFNTVQHDSII